MERAAAASDVLPPLGEGDTWGFLRKGLTLPRRLSVQVDRLARAALERGGFPRGYVFVFVLPPEERAPSLIVAAAPTSELALERRPLRFEIHWLPASGLALSVSALSDRARRVLIGQLGPELVEQDGWRDDDFRSLLRQVASGEGMHQGGIG